jgi:signal transduction histidine kinase
VDVGDVCAETVDLYEDVAEQKGITLTTTAPMGLMVSADRPRLRQVLANLVDNGVKYTPSGGEVRMAASQVNGEVTISVADSGAGIGAEHVAHIWDRLYRADVGAEPGLGLGLSLVRAIVNAHGGRAEVETAPGTGSTFRVTLPAVPGTNGWRQTNGA